MNINRELTEFDARLYTFVHERGLGHSVFEYPEAVEVITASTNDFTEFMATDLITEAERLVVRQRGWRFYAAAKISGKLLLPTFGNVPWLQVAEPPYSKGEDGQRHISKVKFYQPDLESLDKILEMRRIRRTESDEGLNVAIPNAPTLVFTDIGVAERADGMVKQNTAVEVKIPR